MKLLSRALLQLARHLPRGYWRVARFAARRDPALWDLPLPLRFLPNAYIRADLREPVFVQFLRCGCLPHQVGEDVVCNTLLRAGDVVFDVGANIGYTTLLFSNAVGTAGRVIAIEPSRRAFRLLQRSLATQANVDSLRVAASDTEGEALLYETDTLDTSSLVPTSRAKSYSVMTTTVDQLASEFGIPSLVKVDVEGHESSVLGGMSRLLNHDVPPIVLFEALTDPSLQASLGVLADSAGDQYCVYRIKSDGMLGSLDDPFGTSNYLALPSWGLSRVSPLLPALDPMVQK